MDQQRSGEQEKKMNLNTEVFSKLYTAAYTLAYGKFFGSFFCVRNRIEKACKSGATRN